MRCLRHPISARGRIRRARSLAATRVWVRRSTRPASRGPTACLCAHPAPAHKLRVWRTLVDEPPARAGFASLPPALAPACTDPHTRVCSRLDGQLLLASS